MSEREVHTEAKDALNFPIRIGVIGLGNVGLPTAQGFALMGWEVIGADADYEKVRTTRSGTAPFF